MTTPYFHEPRLKMTIFGRFIIRLAGYATYGILGVATIVFILSEMPWLRSVGVLVALFLVDRLVDIRKAARSLDRFDHIKGRTNAALFLEPGAYKIIERSFDQVTLEGGDVAIALLRHLIDRRDIKRSLWRMDVNPDELQKKVDEYLTKSLSDDRTKKDMQETIEKIVLSALQHARNNSHHYIEPIDLLAGLRGIDHAGINRLFELFDVTESDLYYALIFSRSGGALKRKTNPLHLIGKRHRKGHRIMNRAWTARPTYTLDQYSTDLTDIARHGGGGFLVGHDEEYDRLTDVTARPDAPNALLIGEPGSGKEAIVLHLALNIVRDRVPKPLFDKRLVALEIGSLVAGASEGELEKRVKKIIDEILVAKNIILYIPDIHNLLRTAEGGQMTAADVFIPAIKEGVFPVIGATYPREFKAHIEPASDFLAAFEPIRVSEVSEIEATRLLAYESVLLEAQYKIVISLGAVKEAVRLAHKYFGEKLLPGSALDLLKEALTDAASREQKTLLADDVVAITEKRVHVPIHEASKEETEKLLHLEEFIHDRLVDQEPAVTAVSRALREYRSGLSKSGRPIATFLFVGPTGVGKTELSKILAKVQFGSEQFMKRFDMSEYQTKESVFRLIGSPKGEVGGALTDAVRAEPYSLILLDEFEKAHTDVLNIFLAVFDDGRLTDNLGRVVDFQNTIIIATSNAHSEFIKQELEAGRSIEALNEEIKDKLTDYFKPELLNRFSDIIVFKTLSEEDLRSVARLSLNDLAAHVGETNGIRLLFDDSAVEAIARLGYDPVFGARPLRKVISERVRSALAEKILKKEIGHGDMVTISFEGDTFQFARTSE